MRCDSSVPSSFFRPRLFASGVSLDDCDYLGRDLFKVGSRVTPIDDRLSMAARACLAGVDCQEGLQGTVRFVYTLVSGLRIWGLARTRSEESEYDGQPPFTWTGAVRTRTGGRYFPTIIWQTCPKKTGIWCLGAKPISGGELTDSVTLDGMLWPRAAAAAKVAVKG